MCGRDSESAAWYNNDMEYNVTSPKVLCELMDRYNIAPLKRFGQNFLIDGNIADNIVAASVPEGACVLEIGPGFGALTQRLLKRTQRLAAYEIDAGLCAALRDMYKDAAHFTLIHTDFLKAEIEADLKSVFGNAPVYVAANLPYYITSPCILKILESQFDIRMVTVMVQKEVADRICAKAGSGDYGALSAMVGYYAEPNLLMRVSSSCFFPKPDVASAVVQLKTKSIRGKDASEYQRTVKALFHMRRKTVKSNLRQAFGLDVQQAVDVLNDAHIDPNMRAEMLDVDAFERITAALKSKT